MKSIEERAWEKYPEVIKHHNLAHIDINEEKRKMYIEIATEQKSIDEVNYKQGYHDAAEKACNVFCHTGCPHKTDSYNCFNNKCDTWKIFRRMMEEE